MWCLQLLVPRLEFKTKGIWRGSIQHWLTAESSSSRLCVCLQRSAQSLSEQWLSPPDPPKKWLYILGNHPDRVVRCFSCYFVNKQRMSESLRKGGRRGWGVASSCVLCVRRVLFVSSSLLTYNTPSSFGWASNPPPPPVSQQSKH